MSRPDAGGKAELLTRSDCAGKFGERVRDATMHTRIDAEFVVAAADVLHQHVTTDDRARGPVTFQTAHRTESRLQPTVIILDPIVRVLIHVVKRAREKLIDHHTERRGTVGHDLDRFTMRTDRSREEPPCSLRIALRREVHVDDRPVLVNCPVDVAPPSCVLHMGLIDEPAVSDRNVGTAWPRRRAAA